jgi:tryptophan-rich sensory protein
MISKASSAPSWKAGIVAVIGAVIVAGLGGALTDLGPWYQALKQPAWKPPDVLFGPAWMLIYTMIVISVIVGWGRLTDATLRARFIALFVINAVVNVLWSGLFFFARRPDWALVEVGLLWLSIAGLVFLLWRPARLAAFMLLPYLAWVSFAAALNWQVVRLNGPF